MTFSTGKLSPSAKLLPLLAIWIGTSTMAQAGAITYNINFTQQSGGLPLSGSFTYDAGIPQFTNFLVMWDGVTFDLTASANDPFDTGAGAPACLGNLTGAAAGFAWLNPGCQTFPVGWAGDATPQGNSNLAAFNFVESDGSVQIGTHGVNADNAIDQDTGEQGSFTISQVSSTAPEPGSLALLGGGLGLLLFRIGGPGNQARRR